MDYMDYLVLYLETCATSTGGATSKIAGAAFADYVRARGGGPGLNTSFWGYGENEMGAANFDGVARTATYTWTRTTSTSGATSQRNMWIDCHWLPDSAPTWQYSQGIAAYTDTSSMAATPNLMCAASNPMNIQLCDQITDQTRCLNAMRTTRPPILSFCEWVNDGCHVNPLVGGGNGVVTLPAPGGGDSGGPFLGSEWEHVRARRPPDGWLGDVSALGHRLSDRLHSELAARRARPRHVHHGLVARPL